MFHTILICTQHIYCINWGTKKCAEQFSNTMRFTVWYICVHANTIYLYTTATNRYTWVASNNRLYIDLRKSSKRCARFEKLQHIARRPINGKDFEKSVILTNSILTTNKQRECIEFICSTVESTVTHIKIIKKIILYA